MAQFETHRYTITVPDTLARQIEQACVEEGRNRSELLREAFRFYLSNGPRQMTYARQGPAQERLKVEEDKDRLLEQWALMVESAPGFESIRAVSGDVDSVAGEPIA
ncbi:CopG family ribbon-helix-helix protein [Amphibiibacter pelophylacis]|uniref:Ribbon-helix-helix domain-containing protein n=1 Tax=Amphibiibacter pelophylacis TaxID=1799477 RepID=A0ACC6P0L1_9BURK